MPRQVSRVSRWRSPLTITSAAPRSRCFPPPVVGGVVVDVGDLFGRIDDHGDAHELGHHRFRVGRLPGEPLGQDPPELAEQRARRDEGDRAVEHTPIDLLGRAAGGARTPR